MMNFNLFQEIYIITIKAHFFVLVFLIFVVIIQNYKKTLKILRDFNNIFINVKKYIDDYIIKHLSFIEDEDNAYWVYFIELFISLLSTLPGQYYYGYPFYNQNLLDLIICGFIAFIINSVIFKKLYSLLRNKILKIYINNTDKI